MTPYLTIPLIVPAYLFIGFVVTGMDERLDSPKYYNDSIRLGMTILWPVVLVIILMVLLVINLNPFNTRLYKWIAGRK